ncbi:MAG: hypothetical protein JXA67_20605 [Micromonosporaceae bacterium]|nr:hypothetical protein [Micromonosporaceae bacterium]
MSNEHYGTADGQFLKVLLPANAPDPANWTQIKAVGDITGDGLPDLALRAGTAFWMLTGYTGASFQDAVLMEGTAWATREILNIADVDLDGTPNLLWRNLANGNVFLRHGKPGAVAGSADLASIKLAGNSREGDVKVGTGWTPTATTAAIGIPDVNGDRIPDLWARSGTDGQVRVYHPTSTAVGDPVTTAITTDWSNVRAFG